MRGRIGAACTHSFVAGQSGRLRLRGRTRLPHFSSLRKSSPAVSHHLHTTQLYKEKVSTVAVVAVVLSARPLPPWHTEPCLTNFILHEMDTTRWKPIFFFFFSSSRWIESLLALSMFWYWRLTYSLRGSAGRYKKNDTAEQREVTGQE